MKIRQLRHRMTHLLVNRSRNLASLHMGNGYVHVRSSDGGREGFVSIGDGDNDIGLEVVKNRRQFDQAQSRRFRRCDRILPFHHHEHPGRDLKTIPPDGLDRIAVAGQKRRTPDNELKLEIGMIGDGVKRRFNPGIARPGGDDYANFSFHFSAIL